MPLFEKARVEVYIPDAPNVIYWQLLAALQREFTFTFGGATIARGLEGSFLSLQGVQLFDRINLIYVDTPLTFKENLDALSGYADKLRDAAMAHLAEQAILVTVQSVYHSMHQPELRPALTVIS